MPMFCLIVTKDEAIDNRAPAMLKCFHCLSSSKGGDHRMAKKQNTSVRAGLRTPADAAV